MYEVGDLVVYSAQKHSGHPTLNAESVQPEANGEGYRYYVRKYWTVAGISADGSLDIVTRRGKHRRVVANDPLLRRAYWWERLFFADRFPQVTEARPVPPNSITSPPPM